MSNRFMESEQYLQRILSTQESSEAQYVPDRAYEYSQGARDRFESWGVDQSYGDSLIELGYLYSYAYPERKLAQMLTGGLETFTDENQVNQVRFYAHATTDPYLPYGACGELAKRKLIRGVNEGLFENLDTHYGKLMPVIVRAYSPTHFKSGGSRHLWIGVLPEDLYYSGHLNQMVVDDPSFRTITTFDEANYSLDTSGEPPNIYPGLPEIATYYHDTLVGTISFNVSGGYNLRDFHKVLQVNGETHEYNSLSVLGVTRDYTHSVNLSYVRDKNTGILLPLVTIYDAEGYQAHSGIQHSPNEPILASSRGHNLSELSQDSMDQMKEILNLAYNAIATNHLT